MSVQFGESGQRYPEFVLPIVELTRTPPRPPTRRRFLGNGAYIGPDGLLLTAAHVIGGWDHYEHQFIANQNVRVWEGTRDGRFSETRLEGDLRYAKRDGEREGEPVADIVVAQVAAADFHRAIYALVTTRIVRPGDLVYAVGYPESEVSGRPVEKINGDEPLILDLGPEAFASTASANLTTDREALITISTRVYWGRILTYSEETMAGPYPGYRVEMDAPSGLSGAPVFSEKGRIIGVLSSAPEGEMATVTGIHAALRLQGSRGTRLRDELGENLVDD